MQVNSVSSNNVGSFGQREYHAPDNGQVEMLVLEKLANSDNSKLKKMAYREASYAVNDKKHNRIRNALVYGAFPLAAGLAEVVRNPAAAGAVPPIYSHVAKSARFLNLKTFGLAAVASAASMGLIDAVYAGLNKLSRKSETVGDIRKKHPLLTDIGAFGVVLGALGLGSKAEPKLSRMAHDFVSDIVGIKNINKLTGRIDKALNGKVLNKAAEYAGKIPSALKSAGKGIAQWAPLTVLFAVVAHEINRGAVKNSVANRKYDELKAVREEARTILSDMEHPQDETAEV